MNSAPSKDLMYPEKGLKKIGLHVLRTVFKSKKLIQKIPD
jgi:hypothetical protein